MLAKTTASKVSLINTVILICLICCVYAGILNFQPFLSYKWHKLLHLLGVFMFVGNIFVGPTWVLFAWKSKNPGTIFFAFKMLLITDMLVTIPGMDLTILNGLFLAPAFGGLTAQPWIWYTILAMFTLWILVIPVLIIQDRLYFLAQEGDIDSPEFIKTMFWWRIVGALSLIPVALSVYWMVFKMV